MLNLFKKKEKEFKAVCDLSKLPLDRESTYLLTTAEVISSKKFWDTKMTEPDTLTYTVAFFEKKDETARNIRKMIFNKYSGEEKYWAVGDSELHLFEIDEEAARERGKTWWDQAGQYVNGSNSLEKLGSEKFSEMEKYAVEKAGEQHLP